MKMQIVADGRSRLLKAIREKIEARYAKELKAAGPVGHAFLRRRMEAEYREERKKIEPSPYALFSRKKFPGAPG
jgi:hypothetical protein